MAVTEESLLRAYEQHGKRSREWILQAREALPGGDTRASAHYGPYPLFMTHGEGCRLFDLDGHSYTDFMNNFTSLIHGHGHKDVVRAIVEQAPLGTAYAAPTRSQVELAQLLIERVPGLELVRFTSSGSEATEMAVRGARAVTGRPKILKFEGGYHGSHELGEISLLPNPETAGPAERPHTLATDRSIVASSLIDVVVAPFNDADATAALVREHRSELAAVIVEPMLGGAGMIPPAPGFLAALREVTRECDVLLIFDEVITLRVAPGGMQEASGVIPDLVALGKIIGGGLPVGAFGGRRDLMEVFDPGRRDAIFHASTFSGNALTMAAGLAAMRALGPPEYARLADLGERLRRGFDGVLAELGLRGQATGFASLSQLHLGGRVANAREGLAAARRAGRIPRLLHLGLLRRGIFPASRGMYCTSTPMGEAEVDGAIAALRDALTELSPVIRDSAPDLLT
jgi:glutamate-1-semialdehyde 2,1-aminomutase